MCNQMKSFINTRLQLGGGEGVVRSRLNGSSAGEEPWTRFWADLPAITGLKSGANEIELPIYAK
jgi:hypothetical protein